jgi:Methionyl-tRNA formyltransferase
MGNPEFAIPTLKAIQKSNHDLVAVVSNPPKPMGRGKSLSLTPVGEYAKQNRLYLLEPASLNSKELNDELKNLKPDIFVVVAFRILPKSLIELPTYGSINLHASLNQNTEVQGRYNGL